MAKNYLGETTEERQNNLDILKEIADKLPKYLLVEKGALLTQKSRLRGKEILKEWDTYGKFFKEDKTSVQAKGLYEFSNYISRDHFQELKKAFINFGEAAIQPYLDKVREENKAYQIYQQVKEASKNQSSAKKSITSRRKAH